MSNAWPTNFFLSRHNFFNCREENREKIFNECKTKSRCVPIR